MRSPSPCPECGGRNLFRSAKPISAGGGYAPNYLPKLGPWHRAARFHVVVCKDCGLTRWYAHEEALAKLESGKAWLRG